MLINLSNHPSDKWGEKQLDVARQCYGRVQDLPFPAIDPMADTAAVEALAASYLAQIQQMPAVSAVHLMGEMTFLVALVPMLQRAGIDVVCSTTERSVLEEEAGKKTLQFVFVQFRAYPRTISS